MEVVSWVVGLSKLGGGNGMQRSQAVRSLQLREKGACDTLTWVTTPYSPAHRLTGSLPFLAGRAVHVQSSFCWLISLLLCTLAVVMESFLRFYTQIYPSKNSNTYIIRRSAVGVPLMTAWLLLLP